MSLPLLTVIMPVYNGEKFIRDALESVFAQTYSNIEVIVVDDGSTDGTADIVRSYGDRIRYIHQENAGPTIARNTGIAAANGELLAFIDSDDLWVPERLAIQYAALIAEPKVDVTICMVLNFFEPGFEPATEFERNHPKNAPVSGHISVGMVLWKEVMDRIGVFDSKRHHDASADWFLRARAAGVKERVVDQVLVRRRIHADNLSKKQAVRSQNQFLALIKESLDKRRQENAS